MFDQYFVIIWLLLVASIIFISLTKKGRDIKIKLTFGGSVIKDLGIVYEHPVSFGNQKVSLIQCQKQDTPFYVLETRSTIGINGQYSLTPLNDDALVKISELIKTQSISSSNPSA